MDLWRKERIQSVLYKAVKQEDVEMAAKCLKMGAVDVNTRYEPVRSFITRNSNVGVHIRMSKYVYCLIFNFISISKTLCLRNFFKKALFNQKSLLPWSSNINFELMRTFWKKCKIPFCLLLKSCAIPNGILQEFLEL